jgi:hypothetical protein
MRKDQKTDLQTWQKRSDFGSSRPPVVLSSSSFKRYDLENRPLPANEMSFSAFSSFAKFILRPIKNSKNRFTLS